MHSFLKKVLFFYGLVLTCIFTLYRCKVAKEAPYAVFKSPLSYNTSDVTSRYGDNTDSDKLTSSEGQHVTKSPAISPHRNSNKSEHRCSTRDPPRGDTFYRRRTKGKGCKRHRKMHTVAPSQMPPISRAHSTTASMKTGFLNASKSNTMMSNKKRVGKKKSTRKGLSAYPTQRSQVPPQGTTNSYPQTTPTAHSSPSLTQKTALQLHSPTAITAVTKTTKSRRKALKQSRCCGFRMPLRGDTFQPHCKCDRKTASRMTTVTPSTTTCGSPIKVTTFETLRLKKTAETPRQDILKRLWRTATSATPVTAKLKTAASNQKDGKPQKQMDSHLLRDNTSQEPVDRTQAPNAHAERGLKRNIALHNMTGE